MQVNHQYSLGSMIRRMKLREQLSNSEIAKRTGLSRNTVKKWLKAPGDQAPKYKRQSGFTKLSVFEATLVQALKADSHRPKHARRSARALLAQLQAQGYRVSDQSHHIDLCVPMC